MHKNGVILSYEVTKEMLLKNKPSPSPLPSPESNNNKKHHTTLETSNNNNNVSPSPNAKESISFVYTPYGAIPPSGRKCSLLGAGNEMNGKIQHFAFTLQVKRFEIGDYVFLRDGKHSHKSVLDGNVDFNELRIGRLVYVWNDLRTNSYRVKWNRLMFQPNSSILIDTGELIESEIDAIVSKVMCIPVIGDNMAEEYLDEENENYKVYFSNKIDWKDRVFLLALPRGIPKKEYLYIYIFFFS